jgi:hypothetical protein
MTSHEKTAAWRVAIRVLCIVVILAAAAASLRFASIGLVVTIVQVVTGLFVLATCVQAAVDQGGRKAFAAGFAICAVAYLGVANTGAPYFVGGLGTTRVNKWVYESLIGGPPYDPTSGLPVYNPPATDVAELQKMLQALGGSAGRAAQPGTPSRGRTDARAGQIPPPARVTSNPPSVPVPPGPVPPGPQTPGSWPTTNALPQTGLGQNPMPVDFQSVASCLWTLLFGYVGGVFARRVYQRRDRTLDHRPTQTG